MCAYILGGAQFVPHYVRIRDEIVARIQSGDFRVGDQVPSMRELCRLHGVSTITARRAVLDLINDGLVEQRRGVGLFVKGTRRRPRIALVMTGFTEDGWRRNSGMVGQLVGGISSVSWEHEAMLTMLPLDDVANATPTLRRLLDDQPFDGVLIRSAGEVDPAMVALFEERGIPVVCVKRHLPGRDVPCVLSEDRSGAIQVAAHLLERGHRRIGLIVQTSSIESARNLEYGYRQAHAQRGVTVDDSLIARVPRPLAELGRDAAHTLLDFPQPPTAVMVGSDFLALGVYDAAHERRLAIPADLAVAGFDDQDFAARLDPPLTTVHLSYYDLGQAGAQLLFDLLTGVGASSPVVVDVMLVPRASTFVDASAPAATPSEKEVVSAP